MSTSLQSTDAAGTTAARIVTATAAALPLPGHLQTRPVSNPAFLPQLGAPLLVFRGTGWPGTLTLALTTTAVLPSLVAADPAAAFRPAVDSGLSTVGATGPATVETLGAGSLPTEGVELFVVSVDGADAVVMAVHEGEAMERPSVGSALDGDFLRNVHRIREVDMELSVVIGRTSLTVAELLRLKPGQVLELDRAAGAPADVLVNGRLMASGEVVVQDLDYAVRITAIRDDEAETGFAR